MTARKAFGSEVYADGPAYLSPIYFVETARTVALKFMPLVAFWPDGTKPNYKASVRPALAERWVPLTSVRLVDSLRPPVEGLAG